MRRPTAPPTEVYAKEKPADPERGYIDARGAFRPGNAWYGDLYAYDWYAHVYLVSTATPLSSA